MYSIKIGRVDRFEKEVVAYEQEQVQEGLIMFYGDSAFTRWNSEWGNRPIEEDIRRKDGSLAVVRRGLGGSTADELLYYYDRIVRPWKPRALVVNVYSNDRDVAYTPEETMGLLARLFEWCRTDFPDMKLYVCDVRPLLLDIERKDTWYYHQLEFNELLAQYCAKHGDVTLISHIQNPLFFNDAEDVGDYQKVRTDIYIEDKVHWNQLGYDLYKEFFLEALDDIL